MSKPKRHHYLPESYLDGFATRGRLWVFDRTRTEFREQTPKNTAVEGDFYTLLNEDGSKDTTLEGALAAVDGAAVEAIRRVTADRSLAASDKKALAFFVALLRIRTPEFTKQHSELQKAAAAMAVQAFAEGATPIVFEPPVRRPGHPPPTPYTLSDLAKLKRVIERGHGEMREDALTDIPRLAVDLSEIIYKMNWVFYTPARDAFFMTSDSPLWIISKTQGPAGIATPGARKVVALSKGLLLSIHDEGNGYAWLKMPRRAVEGVNCLCALHSDRFIVSSREYALRKVVSSTKARRVRSPPRFSVG